MNNAGIIILAAGNSSRLGRPKQLLPYRGKTLLTHVIAEALSASLHPVVVVTGAYHTEMQQLLKTEPVHLVYNPRWETGMASGIAASMAEIGGTADTSAVIVAVCDQPHISAELFRSLIEEHKISGKGLIASLYSATKGTPVLFGRGYFKELSMLSGDAGAKQLLKRYPDDVATVPFPNGSIDIDTEEDFRNVGI